MDRSYDGQELRSARLATRLISTTPPGCAHNGDGFTPLDA
jgi:hypothetical protein